MGMTLEDAAYEQYISELREEFEEEYADEYRKEGEENFINRRLASYFMQNPDMDARARKRCEDARALLDVNYDACTVLACSAIEVGFKTLLLKPVICGFVNSDHVADLISTAIVSSKPDDKRLRGFLNVLFRNMTSVDLDSFEFGGQKAWAFGAHRVYTAEEKWGSASCRVGRTNGCRICARSCQADRREAVPSLAQSDACSGYEQVMPVALHTTSLQ